MIAECLCFRIGQRTQVHSNQGWVSSRLLVEKKLAEAPPKALKNLLTAITFGEAVKALGIVYLLMIQLKMCSFFARNVLAYKIYIQSSG